jgi:hypothetical protein
MKAIIEKGMVIFPKEVFKKGYLPKKGEVDVETMEGWLKVKAQLTSVGRKRIARRLQETSLTLPIDEIAKNEVIEID